MKRKVVKTLDGTSTLYVPDLDEHYHSRYGAQTESEHIFIRSAFLVHPANPVRVLEYGMGTGLNVYLTWQSAFGSGREVYYHAIEKYPVSSTEIGALFPAGIPGESGAGILEKIHRSTWNKGSRIDEKFTLCKELADFRHAMPGENFDLVYFDAFAPEVQPDLWSVELFTKIFNQMSPGAILVTFSAKGMVRRNLQAAGFVVEKLPGPPGKREITRAVKPDSNNPETLTT